MAGVGGSYIRVLAASYLWKADTSQIIIASGGRPEGYDFLPTGLTLSNILKNELVGLGVPDNFVIEESYSKTTVSQLLSLVFFIASREVGKIFIISNRYHIPRIRAMMENCPFLDKLANLSEIVDAEYVVESYSDNQVKSEIEDFYSSPEGLAIIESEKRGVEQIKNHSYVYRF